MQGTAAVLRRLTNIQTALNQGVPKAISLESHRLAKFAEDRYCAEPSEFGGYETIDVVSNNISENEWEIVASGQELLFIEFGTGYHYKHDNPIQHPDNDPGSWSLGPEGKGFLGGYKFLKYKGFWPLHGTKKWVDGRPSANIFYETMKDARESIPKAVETAIGNAFK